MIRKLAFAVATIAALVASIVTAPAAVTTVSQTFTITKPTAGPMLTLPGGSTYCQIRLDGPAAYAFLSPQESSDTYTWTPLASQEGVSITQGPGVYNSTLTKRYFRFVVSQVNFPGVTGVETCSDQQPQPCYIGMDSCGGATPAPGGSCGPIYTSCVALIPEPVASQPPQIGNYNIYGNGAAIGYISTASLGDLASPQPSPIVIGTTNSSFTVTGGIALVPIPTTLQQDVIYRPYFVEGMPVSITDGTHTIEGWISDIPRVPYGYFVVESITGDSTMNSNATITVDDQGCPKGTLLNVGGLTSESCIGMVVQGLSGNSEITPGSSLVDASALADPIIGAYISGGRGNGATIMDSQGDTLYFNSAGYSVSGFPPGTIHFVNGDIVLNTTSLGNRAIGTYNGNNPWIKALTPSATASPGFVVVPSLTSSRSVCTDSRATPGPDLANCGGITVDHTGAAIAATYHCVYDTVTAAGASTTITLTNSAVFTTAAYNLAVWDYGAFAAGAITAQANNSFTFTSTNTHTYAYKACGT